MSDQSPQETVERALAIAAGIAGVDGCVVLADESSSANVRWANNTLTTNGVTRGRRLTVIASVKGADGVAAGVVSRSSVRTADLDDLVRAAVAAAGENTPAEDAGALVEPQPTGRPGVAGRAPGDLRRHLQGVRRRSRSGADEGGSTEQVAVWVR